MQSVVNSTFLYYFFKPISLNELSSIENYLDSLKVIHSRIIAIGILVLKSKNKN